MQASCQLTLNLLIILFCVECAVVDSHQKTSTTVFGIEKGRMKDHMKKDMDDGRSRFALKSGMLRPYGGPLVSGVDTSTLTGKVMCGYQGWFNCEGDGADLGWTRWARNRHRLFGPGCDTRNMSLHLDSA